MQQTNTLLIGGTGRVVRELVRHFYTQEIPVRALTRSVRKITINVRHTQYIYGKLEDLRTVSLALEGIKKVFLLTGDHPEQAERESNFIDLAVAHGVEHIVKVSAFVAGLEPPVSFGRQHSLVEKKLQQSPLHWTILRPHMFMQNFLDFSGLISGKGLFPSPFGRGRVSFIDTRDIAAVAFHIITKGGHHQKVYELSGPESISFHEATAMIGKGIGKEVRCLSLAEPIARIALRLQGLSAWQVEMLLELSRIIKADRQAHVVPTIEEITGKKPRSFNDFVQDHKARFSA